MPALSVDSLIFCALVALALVIGAGAYRALFSRRARRARTRRISGGDLGALVRRLERAERLAITGEVAARIAHEIKNPLAPIRGYAQLLAGKLEAVAPEERAVFERGLSTICSEVDRIDQRVVALLATARGQREPVHLPSASVLDLNRVVLEAVAVAEGALSPGAITCALDPSNPVVSGAPDDVRGAVLNLLENAIEAMSETPSPRVDVVTRREGDHAILEICDEGPGIAPDVEPHLFETFFTTKTGGTGLGLAIARSGVESAGGALSLASRTDRRGAVARVTLVIAAERLSAELS